MKTRFLLIAAIVLSACLASCGSKGTKNLDDLQPVERIDALSNEIYSKSADWTKDDWDDVADVLENTIADLPNPMTDDEKTIYNAAISRIQVYADRNKREASSVIKVLSEVVPAEEVAKTEEPVEAAPAAPAAAPAPAPAPAAAPEATPSISAAPPKGLLSGSVIREGGYTNVRQGPGTSYSIVTKIKDGSPIYYTNYNANWCKVYNSSGAMLGYMHSSKVIPGGGSVASVPSTRRGVVTGTIYDWLSQRKATAADLAGYDRGQLRVLRNSIYARHGRRFKDAGLRAYFNSQSWYNGYRDEIPAGELSKIEQYNIQFIQRYE